MPSLGLMMLLLEDGDQQNSKYLINMARIDINNHSVTESRQEFIASVYQACHELNHISTCMLNNQLLIGH